MVACCCRILGGWMLHRQSEKSKLYGNLSGKNNMFQPTTTQWTTPEASSYTDGYVGCRRWPRCPPNRSPSSTDWLIIYVSDNKWNISRKEKHLISQLSGCFGVRKWFCCTPFLLGTHSRIMASSGIESSDAKQLGGTARGLLNIVSSQSHGHKLFSSTMYALYRCWRFLVLQNDLLDLVSLVYWGLPRLGMTRFCNYNICGYGQPCWTTSRRELLRTTGGNGAEATESCLVCDMMLNNSSSDRK